MLSEKQHEEFEILDFFVRENEFRTIPQLRKSFLDRGELFQGYVLNDITNAQDYLESYHEGGIGYYKITDFGRFRHKRLLELSGENSFFTSGSKQDDTPFSREEKIYVFACLEYLKLEIKNTPPDGEDGQDLIDETTKLQNQVSSSSKKQFSEGFNSLKLRILMKGVEYAGGLWKLVEDNFPGWLVKKGLDKLANHASPAFHSIVHYLGF